MPEFFTSVKYVIAVTDGCDYKSMKIGLLKSKLLEMLDLVAKRLFLVSLSGT